MDERRFDIASPAIGIVRGSSGAPCEKVAGVVSIRVAVGSTVVLIVIIVQAHTLPCWFVRSCYCWRWRWHRRFDRRSGGTGLPRVGRFGGTSNSAVVGGRILIAVITDSSSHYCASIDRCTRRHHRMYAIGLPNTWRFHLLLLLKLDLHRDGPRSKDGVRRSAPIIATSRRSCARGGGRHCNIIAVGLTAVVANVTHVHGTRKEVLVVVVGVASGRRSCDRLCCCGHAGLTSVRHYLFVLFAIEVNDIVSRTDLTRTRKKGAIHSTPNWAVPFLDCRQGRISREAGSNSTPELLGRTKRE
mmetsp:Transcript_27682/g.64927  ORF Transcript_27682/g.64927 Transcript_27682/m.64927 type:complete len:300 (+) Transcript_27682:1989-2888(+)